MVDQMPDATTPADPLAPASQRVAAYLRRAILSGELPPGNRIMQEEIAASLGSSRLPVREALRIVEAEGLVVLKPNTGAWVSRMDLAECEGTYKIRERLEPLALAESIPRLTLEDIAKLEEIQDQIERDDSVDTFLALDRELHLSTYAACPNEQLTAMIKRFWNTTQHYRRAYTRLVSPSGRRIIHYEHRLIIAAIKQVDIVDAERFLAAHIRRTRLALSRHPELFADQHTTGQPQGADLTGGSAP